MELSQAIPIVVLSYLIGSIPTAYLIGRMRGINIFEVGSGNMGATNAARALGKGWGAVVLFLDAVKGIIAIYLARFIADPQQELFLAENQARWTATVLSAIFVVLGHNWSLFVTVITGELRGGKGAATTFGTFITMAPPTMILALSIMGGLIIARTRYVSLGALSMAAAGFVWMLVLVFQGGIPGLYTFYLVTVGIMFVWRFRENIQRLLTGTERRFGESA
ncbi:MAG: glycerol-3-phosphate acyltransferase [Chloroflexi bacterium]|nr:glycerol-3-phosphate acyltransferase [Chloroflexota bacterium]